VLIDVYRRQWLQGRFIEDQPHANLPGSHWLANTGDGDLTPEWQSYFVRTCTPTAAATGRPLVLLPLRLLVELERGKTRQPGLYLCVLVSRRPGCLAAGKLPVAQPVPFE
jgi:hypothetical protein